MKLLTNENKGNKTRLCLIPDKIWYVTFDL